MDGSPKACWNDQCEELELPALLDPVEKMDVRLIEVEDSGLMGPSRTCVGSAHVRVKRSIELYGLNLPKLKEARLKVMREVNDLYDTLTQTITAAGIEGANVTVADALPVDKQVEMIREKTDPSSPYARAARTHLWRLPGGGEFVVLPEESEA